MTPTEERALKSLTESLFRQRQLTPQMIVFTHVPKAAGSALLNALHEAIQPTRSVSGFDSSVFGGFVDFQSLGSEIQTKVYHSSNEFPRDADFVGGHFCYPMTKTAYPNARHIMILREPNSRLLSQWLYWRTQTELGLKRWGNWADVVRLAHQPLAEFLNKSEAACQIDNVYVRFLLWNHPLVPRDEFIDVRHDRILERDARRALSKYAHVDCLEAPDMIGRLGVFINKPLIINRVNETVAVPRERQVDLHDELTSDALKAMWRRTRLDERLWNQSAHGDISKEKLELIRRRSIMKTVARHSLLLARNE